MSTKADKQDRSWLWLLLLFLLVLWWFWWRTPTAPATQPNGKVYGGPDAPPPVSTDAQDAPNLSYATAQGYARGDTSPGAIAQLGQESRDWLNTYSFDSADLSSPMGVLDAYYYLQKIGVDLTDVTEKLHQAMLRPHV